MNLFLNSCPKHINKFSENVAILNIKNLRLNSELTPFECVEYFLGWFSDVKQPSRKQVKNAILLVIHDSDNEYRYNIKTGGESASDNLFSASVECLVMDKNGNDKMVTFFTKYSNNFDNVLITYEEIRNLILTHSSNAELTKREIEIVEHIPLLFISNSKMQLTGNLLELACKHKFALLNRIAMIENESINESQYYTSIEAYSSKYLVFDNMDFREVQKRGIRNTAIRITAMQELKRQFDAVN